MSLRVVFTGVGEAFDELLSNCSLLALACGRQGAVSVLLDCGFTAPFAFWRLAPEAGLDPVDLDAVWLSHFHGDHCMGLPALLLRLHEEGRTKPLTVVGPPGVAEVVGRLSEMAYGFLGELLETGRPYAVRFVEADDGGRADLLGLDWGFAAQEHSGQALALRLDASASGDDDAGGSLYYSGDGRPTDAGRALARGCGLVVHEAHALDTDTPGHGTVRGAVDFARGAGAAVLALVHISRSVRHDRRDELARLAAAPEGLAVLIPEAGDALDAPQASIPMVAPQADIATVAPQADIATVAPQASTAMDPSIPTIDPES